MDETDFQVLTGGIQGIAWDDWPDTASVNSRHELLKAEIVRIGREFGYRPIPEVYAYEGSDNSRIDVVWFDDGEKAVALEVDGAVKRSSVEKLQETPEGCIPVIVSKSPNESRIESKVEELLPEEFRHIDAKLHQEF